MTGKPTMMKDLLGQNTGTTPKKKKQSRIGIVDGKMKLTQ
jgi:hypothetical protein